MIVCLDLPCVADVVWASVRTIYIKRTTGRADRAAQLSEERRADRYFSHKHVLSGPSDGVDPPACEKITRSAHETFTF